MFLARLRSKSTERRALTEIRASALAIRPGAPCALERANAFLLHDDHTTRLIAIRALGKIDPRSSRRELWRLAREGDKWERAEAVDSLRRIPGRDVWPELCWSLLDEADGVFIRALRGLKDRAGPGDIAELLDLQQQLREGRRNDLRPLIAGLERSKRREERTSRE